jgi:hypothetical protein
VGRGQSLLSLRRSRFVAADVSQPSGFAVLSSPFTVLPLVAADVCPSRLVLVLDQEVCSCLRWFAVVGNCLETTANGALAPSTTANHRQRSRPPASPRPQHFAQRCGQVCEALRAGSEPPLPSQRIDHSSSHCSSALRRLWSVPRPAQAGTTLPEPSYLLSALISSSSLLSTSCIWIWL